MVREEFGLGLRQSLELVEALEEEFQPSAGGRRRSGKSFGTRRFSSPDKVFSILSIAFLGVAALLLTIGAVLAFNTSDELKHALELKGRVVEFAYGSDGGYIPVVEFVQNGKQRKVQGTVASTPAAYDIGEQVTVYVTENGQGKVMIDGIFELWIGPIILTFIGAIFLLIGGGMYAINR